MRYYFTPIRITIIQKKKNYKITSVGEGVEKLEPFHTVVRNVKWYSHYGKQYDISSEKLKIEPPYDPAILLPSI